MNTMTTHRTIQISQTLDVVTAKAAVFARCAVKARSINNRSAASHFDSQAAKCRFIAERCRERLVPSRTFGDFSESCNAKISVQLIRRPANALNVEIGQAMDRCMRRSPDGRGLAWMRSGGEVLAYGTCIREACPRLMKQQRGQNMALA